MLAFLLAGSATLTCLSVCVQAVDKGRGFQPEQIPLRVQIMTTRPTDPPVGISILLDPKPIHHWPVTGSPGGNARTQSVVCGASTILWNSKTKEYLNETD